jgi:chaperonin GroEL (HSP60 family)
MFINEPGTQKVIYEKPTFVLYFGRITDIQTITHTLQMLQEAWNEKYLESPNVVLVATGFSENVLANLANMAVRPDIINIFPLVVPNDVAVQNAPKHFLDDLAAVTGTEVFDPLTKPLNDARLIDFGNLYKDDKDIYRPLGIKFFEAIRYRSSVIGHCDDDILLARVDAVRAGLDNAESEYDRIYIQERLAKLSSGIAKLKVIGASNGELKERRDRAEDAVCAVRGAIKNGALIGGGWTIQRLIHEMNELKEDQAIATQIIAKSLQEVLDVLYLNAGFGIDDLKPEDAQKAIGSVLRGDPKKAVVLDLSCCEVVSAFKLGLLDSAPALEEALKNSISAAALLGTTGGCVVFPRDSVAEHNEARDAQEFERYSKDFVDERAI